MTDARPPCREDVSIQYEASPDGPPGRVKAAKLDEEGVVEFGRGRPPRTGELESALPPITLGGRWDEEEDGIGCWDVGPCC